jgi:hypothetical protein
MPTMDIFNNDAFSVSSLTKAINETAHVPGRLGALGLFSEEGITTTSIQIEKVGESLSLVPAGERGAPANPVGGDKRTMLSFNAIHLPQRSTILADTIQNVRAFGSENELQTVQGVVNQRLAKHRRNLDATIEFQRMGALKGLIVDADGSTPLVNLFTQFGVSQQVQDMDFGGSTDPRANAMAAKRKVEDALGNGTYTGLRAFCSADFFDAMIGDADVKNAYDRWMDGEFLRNDPRGGFFFGGIYWEEYRGNVGGNAFIAAGDAYLVPEGVPDLLVTHYAPADYMETVNTIGLPYYAKQEELRMGKGIDLESQANPISICTHPRAIIRLTAT